MRLFLLVNELRVGLFQRWGKKQKDIHDIITNKVLPDIIFSMSVSYLQGCYPWSFVITLPSQRRNFNYVGAFMLQPGTEGETSLFIVYGEVSGRWLKKNMQAEYPLTFWASRILNSLPAGDIAAKNWQPLWHWVKALGRAYSPFWETVLLAPEWQFKNHSQVLLREGAQDDYLIQSSDGVEVMPWQDWPGCIQQETGIWIWRQSRHGKILDSQRILLQRAEAESPDATF